MLNVLVVKTSSLGDIIQTIPTILKLKKTNPKACITWVVEKKFEAFLQDLQICDELIVCDFKTWKKKLFRSIYYFLDFRDLLRKKSFDLVLDFQGNIKSALILSQVRCKEKRGYKLKDVPEWPNIFFTTKKMEADSSNCTSFYDSLVQDLIHVKDEVYLKIKTANVSRLDVLGKKVVMMGFGSAWESKKLSLSQMQELLAKINLDQNPYFLIPCEAKEEALYQEILKKFDGEVLCFENIKEYFPYFMKIDQFIGVDSAFLHLAKLFGKKTLGLFGPSSKAFYGNLADIQGTCPYGKKFIKRCPLLRSCHAPCIKDLRF
jgi:heptosyltransferase-1